ncbi:carbohydrate sulfotransferase 3-like [Plutella xylostella]|uniref:carbohydrate sulfotransferase 3-like n=1 Tax=Plutella xylostella TaxID=51655 RepID=UPI0020328995|nr:carbohydrate sulfotransferase 3-like [Plutella xylostella]
MFQRIHIKIYLVILAFSLSGILILFESNYTDKKNYRPVKNRICLPNSKIDVDNDIHQPPSAMKPVEPGETLVIDKIIQRQRLVIASEYGNSNFSASKLEDLLLEAGGQPVRSLIISSFRSGSTFLSEILNTVPANFNFYEPLIKYSAKQVRGPPGATDAVNILKNMLKCNVEGMRDYLSFGRGHTVTFRRNPILSGNCKRNKLCEDARYTSKFCKLFPFQSMKVVRLRLRLIEDILQDKDFSNLKVVLLVRDPRGVLSSRQTRSWCRVFRDCWDPAVVCADMASDYVALTRLQTKFPNRLTAVRFEDLALNYTRETRRLFQTLGRPMGTGVEDYLKAHTNTSRDKNAYSTYRVSHDVPFQWTNVLDYRFVSEIQEMCSEAMALWGYRAALSARHMRSRHFQPVGPYDVTQGVPVI